MIFFWWWLCTLFSSLFFPDEVTFEGQTCTKDQRASSPVATLARAFFPRDVGKQAFPQKQHVRKGTQLRQAASPTGTFLEKAEKGGSLVSALMRVQMRVKSRWLPYFTHCCAQNNTFDLLLYPRLVALYRAMRLRFGYGFESCDANGPRNVKNTNLAKQRPIVSSTTSPCW